VKRAIASSEALFFKEERVVEKSEGVEHIEVSLLLSVMQ
jgi:hypothetical protein